jgi:predicted transcriptional regulator
MTDQKIKNTLSELKAWIDQKHGRNLLVAKMLGVSPQLVSDWFSNRPAVPRVKTWLKITEFLQKSDRARRKEIGEI